MVLFLQCNRPFGTTNPVDKSYLSGAAASLDRAARAPPLAAPTTTNGSPRLYSGASRT